MANKPSKSKSKKLWTKDKGRQGEKLAKKLLVSKGYHFLEANFQTKIGEIDLIFENDSTLIFVEVKTRTCLEQGLPEEAVTPHKIHKITQVANWYMQAHRLDNQLARIDVVAVELTSNPPKIRHLINVTG